MISTLASPWSSVKRDDGGIEPGVEGVEHGAGHGDAVMRFQHRRRVGEHDRDRVAALDAALCERRGQVVARARKTAR